jgi:cell wall-associated NlpC family hydrolase
MGQGEAKHPLNNYGSPEDILFQGLPEDARGAFQLLGPAGDKAAIYLTSKMDVTTVPHEMAHFLAHFGLSSEDRAIVEKWAGPLNSVDAHEKFARGIEAYIRSGEAPNNLKAEFKVLQPAFHAKYPSAGDLPSLSPEMADVYKKLLGHRDGLPAAAYFALRGKIAGHSLAIADRRGPDRSPEETQGYLAQLNEQARGEGFGTPSGGKPAELQPGEQTPETGGALGALVRAGMKDPSGLKALGEYERIGATLDNAPKTIGQMEAQQEAARGIARSKKAGSLHAAQQDALASDNPYRDFMAAGAARKGMLPKSDFKGFDTLEPHLNDLTLFVGKHPNLKPFERQRLMEAITRGITENRMPARAERRLIAKAFGREAASGWAKAVRRGEITLADVLNLPRAAMSSGDLSAGLRQGLAALFYKPNIFFADWTKQLEYAFSEGRYQEAMRMIEEHPNYALMNKGKVSFTDIHEPDLNMHEEAFGSQLAEQLPIVGRFIRGSDRAYTGFLNVLRAHLFDYMVNDAAMKGWNLDEHALESIGSVVNALTGRGNLPEALAEHRAFLNGMFFSPGLAFSRLNFLGFGGSKGWKMMLPGSWYASLHPYARREAMRTLMRLTSGLSTMLWFAHMAGAQVSLDPRNADFGKIRIGDTRFDIAGGFQQWVRLISEMATGQIVSSTTGRVEHLGGGFAQETRLDAALQFLEGKAAPVPSMIIDLLRGTGFGHQPVTVQNELSQHVVPLAWHDIWDIARSNAAGGGVKMAAIATIPDLLGVGVQNYTGPGPQTHKNTDTLLEQSKQAGLPQPPQAVLDDVKWKSELDAATYAGQKPIDKAKEVIDLFDKRYGTDLAKTVLPHITTEGQAEALYQELRSRLFPALSQWQSAVDSRLNQQKGKEPVPQQPAPQPSSATPPQAPPLQETAYHVPAAPETTQRPSQTSTARKSAPVLSQTASPAPTPSPHVIVQPTGVVPDALTLAADQGLSDLASGQYSPSQALGQLFRTLSQQPLQNTVQTPDGLHIKFQIPKLAGAPGKAARGAVALAQAYLGTPYVWGGESPAGFDCSGLAQYVYAKMGIDIPRTTFDQFKTGASVPKSRLRPGDLVFFAGSDGSTSNPGHVGIYIGHGKFIEAPHSGATVRVSNLAGYPGYVGARRYSTPRRKAA